MFVEEAMTKNALKEAPRNAHDLVTPNWRQHAKEIQSFGTVIRDLPIGLSEDVRRQVTERLNLLLADTASMRDLYKKSHWQVGGPTFYQLHLLFDKHFGEQVELVDLIAERIQILGGVSVAMAHDIAELTRLARPPKGREEVPVQISRLLEAHEQIIKDTRDLARKASDLGDDGTNDLLISNVLRTNEMQVWFLSEHLVEMPLVLAS
jgi:starvation-inducible DNA-binding protein